MGNTWRTVLRLMPDGRYDELFFHPFLFGHVSGHHDRPIHFTIFIKDGRSNFVEISLQFWIIDFRFCGASRFGLSPHGDSWREGEFKAAADLLIQRPKRSWEDCAGSDGHALKTLPSTVPMWRQSKPGSPQNRKIYNSKLEAYFHEVTSPILMKMVKWMGRSWWPETWPNKNGWKNNSS